MDRPGTRHPARTRAPRPPSRRAPAVQRLSGRTRPESAPRHCSCPCHDPDARLRRAHEYRWPCRDIHLGTHRIPEGADVVWSPYLHQHDPEHFPDPDCFAPDRWTPERAPTARGSFLASATDAANVSARTSLGPSCRSSCRPTCSSGPAWSSPPAPHAPKPSPPSNPTQ
ncbi:cytochrome P450 [Streptomyces hirsutus]|uniref:cytochrome P450 n=1 Tax=Streptomyces hirsutus TaxID=35620 RepID=UPI00331869C9